MLNAIPITIIHFSAALKNEYLRFAVPNSDITPQTIVGNKTNAPK